MSAFDAIIGYEDTKERLRRVADVLRNTERYTRLGARPARGLMLCGEPGLGKTLMARCLIEESGRAAFTCRKDAPNGAFVEIIKETFSRAAQAAPSIVFLDDIDKFANEDERHRDAEEYVTVQSCIDELGATDVFVLATANDVYKLPGSLVRQGRLGNTLRVRAPEGADAEAIISHYLGNKRCLEEVDVPFLSRLLGGRSCADLEEVVNAAGLLAAYRGEERIVMRDLLQAVMSSMYDVPESAFAALSATEASEERRRIAYHEAGHVVINEVLDPGSVTIASILGNSHGKGGFVLSKCSDDTGSLARVETDIVVSLGGRAAVEQRFGTLDVGAEKDLSDAFRKVKHLVSDLGACGLGLVYERYTGSEAIESYVAHVVAVEAERYYRKAKEILAQNVGLLDAVAHGLLERGIVTMHDIEVMREDRSLALFQ